MIMNVRKKLLAWVLAISMMVGMLPLSVLAAGEWSVTLGNPAWVTENGTFQFPEATVTAPKNITSMTVTVTAGSIKTTGATMTELGNRSATWIFSDGKTASEVAVVLKDITFDYEANMQVTVTLDGNAVSGNFTGAKLTEYDGHYYMFVEGLLSWHQAYNGAKAYTYKGMGGYLATITTTAEAEVLRKIDMQGAWTGGTLLLLSSGAKIGDATKIENAPGSLKRPDSLNTDDLKKAYYWACGPEQGAQVPADLWSDNEPNGRGLNNQTAVDDTIGLNNPDGESCVQANYSIGKFNDNHESNVQGGYSIKGYFVEFGGYGSDPAGGYDSTKAVTAKVTLNGESFRETNLYVSKDGKDETGKGTKEEPYATIEYAAGKAQSGDTIILCSDVTQTGQASGIKNKTLTITSDGTAKTITMSGTASTAYWHLSADAKGATHITLKNIVMDGGTHTDGSYGEFFIDGRSALTLGEGAVLQNFEPRAVNVRSGGTLTMLTGSRITDCTAGVNLKYSGDGYPGTADQGSAVYVCPSGTFDMRGGAITGNSTTGFAVFGENGSTFKMGGDVAVKDNTAVNAGDVYLGNVNGASAVIQLTRALTCPEGSIGVYTKQLPTAGSPVTIVKGDGSYTPAETDAKAFYSNNAKEAGIEFNGADHTIRLSVEAKDAPSEVWVDQNAENDDGTGEKDDPLKTLTKALGVVADGGAIKLLSNVDFDSVFSKIVPETAGKSITIVSDPETPGTRYTINCVGATGLKGYAQFYVAGGSALTLKNVIVDGKKDARENNSVYGDFFIGPTIDAPQNATASLTLDEGVTLQNFYPRAVNVRGRGTVIMKPGSKITGCEAGINAWYNGDKYNGTDGVGAAVYVCPNGTFDMQGGIITDNTADGYNGDTDGGPETVQSQPTTNKNVVVPGGVAGIFGEQGAIFKMSGAPVVTGNTFLGAAANVYLNDGATIKLTGKMTEEASVGVYVEHMPTPTSKLVTIAEGDSDSKYEPVDTDANGFSSDKATEAGVSFQPTAKTVVLDYDARSVTGGVDAGGEGFIQAEAAANMGYAVLDKEGKPITTAKAYDKDGRELTPNNGWYHTDNGPITFRPIQAGSTPVVVSVPTGQMESTTPESKKDSGTGVSIPAVNEKQLSAEIKDGSPKTASITVEPAAPDLVYGLVDKDGKEVSQGAWKAAENGKVVFDGLDPSKEYKVVAKPKTDTTTSTADQAGTGVAVKTPAEGFENITADAVTRDNGTNGSDKIVLDPTVSGQEYAIIDKATGQVVAGATITGGSSNANGWATSNGGEITFDGLDPDKDYEVVTRTPGTPPSIPGKGVDVPKNTVKPGDVTTGADANGKSSITVGSTDPDTKYALVDKDGNVVAPVNGDKDGWITGNGGELTFNGLDAGGEYQVVTQPKVSDSDKDGVEQGGNTPKPSGNSPYPNNISNKSLVGPTVKIPVVTPDQLTGRVESDVEDENDLADAYITIKPTDPDLSYAVVDSKGNVVTVDGTTDGWKDGSKTEALDFGPLNPGEKYEVVAVSKTENKPATDLGGTGTAITAPGVKDSVDKAAADTKVAPEDIDRKTDAGAGKDTITIRGEKTKTELEYAVMDPVTGEVVKDEQGNPIWKPGTNDENNDLFFEGLDPNKKYEVVTRPAVDDGSIPVTTRPGTIVDKAGALKAVGRILDADGNPIEGATVKVTVADMDGKGYQTLIATTAADGTYTLEGNHVKLPGSYKVYVDSHSEKGVMTKQVTLSGTPPQNLGDIKVAPSGRTNTNIIGGAVSDHGAPVKDAVITVIDKATGKVDTAYDGLTPTSEGGGFALGNLDDGTYIFQTTIEEDGVVKTGMTEVKVEGGKIVPNTTGGYKNTNIPVTPGGFVSGRVDGLDKGETATISMNVPVYDDAGKEIGTKTVTGVAEGDGGYWQIAGVPDGKYPVTVTTPDGTLTGTVTVADGKITAATEGEGTPDNSMNPGTGADDGKLLIKVPTEQLEKPNVITGAVVDKDNKPVKNATVTIYNEKGEPVGTATTGEGGGYNFPNDLPAGKYYISADTKDGKNGLTGPIEVQTDGTTKGKTSVTVSDGVSKLVEGAVTKADGTTKAAGATVTVKDKDGNVIATTKTDSNGQYFVGSVPADATVTITTTDGEDAEVKVGATTPDGAYNGDAKTRKTDDQTLVVIGPSGEILPVQKGGDARDTAKISVVKTGAEGDKTESFAVSDGKLTLYDEPPTPDGIYTVTVEQNGMVATHTIEVKDRKITSGSTMTIAPHQVSGTVKYEAGTIPSDASITVPGWGESRVNTVTGKYELSGIPDGVYEAVIKVTDSESDITSEIKVELKVENGVASYTPGVDAATGANVTASGSDLTVTPTTSVNGVKGKIDAAKEAIAAVDKEADDYSAKLDAAIAAVRTAQDAISSATEEELKQMAPEVSQELAAALAELMAGKLAVTAMAQGMSNATAVTAALNAQKGMLVDDSELTTAKEANRTVEISLVLKADDVTDEPTSSVNKDVPKVEAVASAVGAKATILYEIAVEKTTVVKETPVEPEAEAAVISETTTSLTKLPAPITITLTIPTDLRGYEYYSVLRVHEHGSPERIPSTADKTTVTFASNLYSTYAILASNDPMFADDAKVDQSNNDHNNNGGSSSGSSSTGGISIDKTTGGKVTVSPSNPKKDDKVTITVTPDEGYTLDTLVIKDNKGNEIKYVDNGDGTYTYTQPSGKVTIHATFRKVTGDPHDNGVDRLLIVDDHIAFMQGDDKGNFGPGSSITRAETAQMFYNLLKDKNVNSAKTFTDVGSDAWYAKAVQTLSELGILNGRGNGIFDPNAPITRAEFASIATRFALRTNGTVTFTDVPESHWAHEAIGMAAYYGWINGYENNTFKPDANITRAEAAKVVDTMLARCADKSVVDANTDELKTFPDVAKDYWAFYEIVEATNTHDFTLDKDGVETWTR